MGKKPKRLTPEVVAMLDGYAWPGNIRELENVIERAFILCGDGTIDLPHLPVELTARAASADPSLDIRRTRAILDAETIRAALDRADGHRTRAARELGIDKSTLYRLIKRLGVTPPALDGRSRPPR
jgi:transcriptional regulator of acetoin/glycerol metabolism